MECIAARSGYGNFSCQRYVILPRQILFCAGKPGLPRNANIAKNKYLIIRRLKISKSLLRGTPGLPPQKS